MIRVLFICHGNICRSTMAQSVMTYLVENRGLASLVYIDSAATSREEIGSPPHHGTVEKLRRVGIPLVPHRAVQLVPEDYERYDYLVGMDDMNIKNMRRILKTEPDDGKIFKLLDFTGEGTNIADPWYTGNFDETYSDILDGCNAMLDFLIQEGLKSE